MLLKRELGPSSVQQEISTWSMHGSISIQSNIKESKRGKYKLFILEHISVFFYKKKYLFITNYELFRLNKRQLSKNCLSVVF